MVKLKGKESLLLIGAALVVGVLILGQMGVMPFAMTVKSITLTKQMSNDIDLQNTFFVIATNLTGDAQKIIGTGELDTAENQTDFQTSYPIELKAIGISETATFEIINDNEPIYYFDIFERSRNYYWEEVPVCPSGYREWQNKDIIGQIMRVLCVQQRPKGTKGHIENPSIGFKANISMKVGNWLEEKVVSNVDRGVDFYKNNEYVGNVSWTGSLITGDPLPSTSNLVAVYQDQDSKWHLRLLDTWNNYRQIRQNAIGAYNIPINSCYDASCFATIHSAMGENNNFYWGTDRTINGVVPSDNLINVNLDRRITIPEIVWKVRADVVGTILIYVGVGQPQILENSLVYDFESGNQERILNFNVRNIGNAEANFASSIDCQNFTTFSSFTASKTFNPGETKVFTLKILSGSQTNVTENCNLKVYDTSKPSNSHSIPILISVGSPTFCGNGIKEGTEECDTSDLSGVTCQDFGYDTGVLTCTHNCQFNISGCSYSQPDPREECLTRMGDGIFISAWTWVETNTPEYLFGFLPIQIGISTESSCQPVYNWPLVILGIVAIVGLIGGLFVWKRYG